MKPLLNEIRRNPMLWLLVCVPVVFGCQKLKPESHTLLFVLSVFAIVVSREVHAAVGALLDRYFAAWNEHDPSRRRKLIGEIADEHVEFQDAFAAIRGAGDLDEHIAAIHLHMPGTTIERRSEPRHCQGHVLVEWAARRNGTPAGAGTNYFDISAWGRIRRVVGFWAL
jgi:hypothetical protein